MTSDFNSCFIIGHVYHSRSETAENSFRYPILNLLIDVSEFAELNAHLKSNYFRVLSVSPVDFIDKKNSDLFAKIKSFVLQRFDFKFESDYDYVLLQTMPRMFGYVFNPVNFWYFKKNNEITSILCEVNNTFGEKHFYWLSKTELQTANLNAQWITAEKQFHVSPFFDLHGCYRFKFVLNETRIEANIQYLTNQNEMRLITWVKGSFSSLQSLSLLQILIRYGWMTPLVVFRIHYQALKLYLKKVKFYTKPPTPKEEVTHGKTITGS